MIWHSLERVSDGLRIGKAILQYIIFAHMMQQTGLTDLSLFYLSLFYQFRGPEIRSTGANRTKSRGIELFCRLRILEKSEIADA